MRLQKAIGISFWLLVVVVALSGTSESQEISIVSPSDAGSDGDSSEPAGFYIRSHILYHAADFMSLPDTHRTIVEIAYRPDLYNEFTDPVSGPLRLRLSTTATDSLSTVLAENIEGDETLVFDDWLTWQDDIESGPRDFVFVVPFDEPFMYDPSQGKNLLVNFAALRDWTHAGDWQMDLQSTDYESWAGEGASWSRMPVTEFTFVSVGDFNSNGVLDAEDIDLLSAEMGKHPPSPRFDLNEDGSVDADDHEDWVHDWKNTWLGDANLDLEFNSSDMVQVFDAGKYETGEDAGWAEGDWNGDAVFDSSDMVTAFADGGYERGSRADASAVPEPTSVLLLVTGVIAVAVYRRRPRR